MKSVPYVYKWTETSTNKWYVGVRYAKGCHPTDGYICSSKIVKPLIQNNIDEWTREIIDTGSIDEMLELEDFILRETQAPRNPLSYNQSYANGHGTTNSRSEEHKQRNSEWHTGKVVKEETKRKLSVRNTGKNHPQYGIPKSSDTRAKISAAKKGKPMSGEARQKMSEFSKGKTYEELYGKEAADKRKAKLRQTMLQVWSNRRLNK